MVSKREKVNKAAWNLMNAIKDKAVADVLSAISVGKIKVEAQHKALLVSLLSQSIESGYHKGFSFFVREVDAALKETEKEETKSTKKK